MFPTLPLTDRTRTRGISIRQSVVGQVKTRKPKLECVRIALDAWVTSGKDAANKRDLVNIALIQCSAP